MVNPNNNQQIRSEPCPTCYLCGSPGRPLYRGLKDRLFGAWGEWNLNCCPNSECGLSWLDPMPSLEDIHKAYENYYTHVKDSRKNCISRKAYHYFKYSYLSWRFGYDTGNFPLKRLCALLLFFLPLRRANVDREVMYLSAQPGGRLLDVGCGSGERMALLQSLGWQTQGIDLDEASVQLARENGLKAYLGDLKGHHFPENNFDVITMNHVIEHVHDPLSLLLECFRILKPKGRLIITTPNLDSYGHARFGKSWMPLDPPRHLFLYNSKCLAAIIQRSKLYAVTLITKPFSAKYNYLASRAISINGNYVMGSARPLLDTVMGYGFYWLEKVLVKYNPILGEELLLIAEKVY